MLLCLVFLSVPLCVNDCVFVTLWRKHFVHGKLLEQRQGWYTRILCSFFLFECSWLLRTKCFLWELKCIMWTRSFLVVSLNHEMVVDLKSYKKLYRVFNPAQRAQDYGWGLKSIDLNVHGGVITSDHLCPWFVWFFSENTHKLRQLNDGTWKTTHWILALDNDADAGISFVFHLLMHSRTFTPIYQEVIYASWWNESGILRGLNLNSNICIQRSYMWFH